jgi:hypothetical protein
MIISVINHSGLSDEEVQSAIRAVNRQIAEDFEPHWSMGATLRLEGRLTEDPDLRLMAMNMRGDAILYLEDSFNPDDSPLGYHNRNYAGIPYGFVYTELADLLGEPWQVTLSHEALELLADPEVNLLVMGPHPDEPERLVFHWYEMCDAVQAEHYVIDGEPVSNFVLPLYFTEEHETQGRNEFLGTTTDGRQLNSFSINPGGYVGYFDPQTGQHENSFANDTARNRFELKSQLGLTRRGVRYNRELVRGSYKSAKQSA